MGVVQIFSGAFQDAEGVVLANGEAKFNLSADAVDALTGTIQICAGETATFALDINGNVTITPPSYLWPNDLILSVVTGNNDTFYWMTIYDDNGQRVYGPNAYQILSNPSPFNLNVLVPGNPA